MFDIKELSINEPSVFTGSYALEGLQNNHTFLLDLLVRETIQNSSDAAIIEKPFYRVDYNQGSFRNDDLSWYFTRIEDKINERYRGQTCSFLEIRDTNTVGLTGSTEIYQRSNATKSNYLRLIFDMGKGQDQTGAGGRWGLGKTVCYRLGVGFVVYYSRIKCDNGFESRLVLTLVEDEMDPNAFLRTSANNSAGRAWWGEIIKDNGVDDFEPIKDDELIKEFLAVFNLQPFEGEETGTSIIIPYIDENRILEEAKSSMKVQEDVDIGHCTFLNSIDDYLRYSVQKWYAPVLNNHQLKEYGKRFLNVYVNGKSIVIDDMYPIFKLVNELYTTAYASLCGKHFRGEYPLECKRIVGSWHQIADLDLGYLSFCRIKINDLNKGIRFHHPNIYMNISDENKGNPISLYTRELGMILNYEESWVDNRIVPCEPTEMLIMLFVPNTSMEYDYGNGLIKLGEYLRQREESDHMKWDGDPPKMKKKCVKIIKKTVEKTIKNHYCPDQQSETGESNYSEFAGILGEKLFPKKQKKTKGGSSGNGGGGGTERKEKKFAFKTFEYSFIPGGKIKIPFELVIKESASVVIKTKIQAGIELIDSKGWKDKIGTSYPLSIASLTIENKDVQEEIGIDYVDNNVMISGNANKISGHFFIEATDKTMAFVVDCQEHIEVSN